MTKAKKLAGAGDVVVHVQSSKKKGKKEKYIKKIWQNNKHHYIHKEEKRNYVLAPHVKMIKAFTVILNLGQIRLTLCNHM